MTVHKLTPARDLQLVVLLVEDELLVRCEIANYLRSRGWLVLETGTAQEGIAIGRRCTVDVLLTDIDLAGSGSGWEVAEALRAAQPDIGVIYVSANPVDQDRRVSDSLCFCKPYSEAVILQACHDLAHERQRKITPDARMGAMTDHPALVPNQEPDGNDGKEWSAADLEDLALALKDGGTGVPRIFFAAAAPSMRCGRRQKNLA